MRGFFLPDIGLTFYSWGWVKSNSIIVSTMFCMMLSVELNVCSVRLCSCAVLLSLGSVTVVPWLPSIWAKLFMLGLLLTSMDAMSVSPVWVNASVKVLCIVTFKPLPWFALLR